MVLPPERLHWVTSQPASVVSQNPLVDGVHKFLGTGIVGDITLADLLRKELVRNDDEKVAVLYDEIRAGLDHEWGRSREWTTVDLRSSLRTINARLASRIFVGLPLCMYLMLYKI